MQGFWLHLDKFNISSLVYLNFLGNKILFSVYKYLFSYWILTLLHSLYTGKSCIQSLISLRQKMSSSTLILLIPSLKIINIAYHGLNNSQRTHDLHKSGRRTGQPWEDRKQNCLSLAERSHGVKCRRPKVSGLHEPRAKTGALPANWSPTDKLWYEGNGSWQGTAKIFNLLELQK